jgi:hypothetical protein
MTRGVIQALLLVSLASSNACFSYVAVPMTTVAPKEDVRVLITNDAGARLVKELGIYTTQLDGEFAAHGDSVSVTVPIVREYRGQLLDGANQSLYLGRSEVVEIRQRQFSRSRTVLATVGLAAGFVGLVTSIKAIADPNPDKEEPLPPPPVGARVPLRPLVLIRIPIP